MEDYVLLKGRIKGKWYDLDKTAHYHIIAETPDKEYDIAVNIGSVERKWGSDEFKSSELLVYHDESYNNRILDKIAEKDYGIHIVKPDFALDYVKMDLFDPKKMVLMPTIDTKKTYLIEVLEKYVSRSMEKEIYDIYVYGMMYENGLGIHDVHMNQGSEARYRHRDREWSDGALFLHNRENFSWTAVFLAFKNQDFKRKR